MISAEWLYKWKCFVKNKISNPINLTIKEKVPQSLNEKIGILPPGPITNYTLFVNDGITPDRLLSE